MDRAARIRELQKGRTGSADEAEIQSLLLDTHGRELTALKNDLDSGDDHRDLVQLLYSDIDDPTIRAAILVHFEHEAKVAPANAIKVLSDIDDTFYANWTDDRFPKKTVYPGVMQFYAELGGHLTFVTARPMDRVGLIEKATHGTLRERGLKSVTVLSGSFKNLIGNTSIAKKKQENFQRYVSVFPEYDFVFVGDSGQGDALFGKQMLEAEPDRVKAVFIHDIGKDGVDRQDAVLYFKTYAGAAMWAHQRGLMDAEAVARVRRAVIDEYDRLWSSIQPDQATLLKESLASDLEGVAGILG